MQYTNLTISNLKNLRKIMEKLAINKSIFFRQKMSEIALVMSVWSLLRNRAYAQRGVAFLDLVLAPKCHDRVRMQRQLFYYHDVSDVILLIHCCCQGRASFGYFTGGVTGVPQPLSLRQKHWKNFKIQIINEKFNHY